MFWPTNSTIMLPDGSNKTVPPGICNMYQYILKKPIVTSKEALHVLATLIDMSASALKSKRRNLESNGKSRRYSNEEVNFLSDIVRLNPPLDASIVGMEVKPEVFHI